MKITAKPSASIWCNFASSVPIAHLVRETASVSKVLPPWVCVCGKKHNERMASATACFEAAPSNLWLLNFSRGLFPACALAVLQALASCDADARARKGGGSPSLFWLLASFLLHPATPHFGLLPALKDLIEALVSLH